MKIRLGILYLSISVFLCLECTGDSGGLTGTETTGGLRNGIYILRKPEAGVRRKVLIRE